MGGMSDGMLKDMAAREGRTGFWNRAWGERGGRWGWGRWVLFVGAVAGIWWDPSSGLADALLVAAGVTALVRPGRLWRAWGNPAGLAFAFLAAWAVASAGWSLEGGDVWRDCTKSLPLALGVMGLGAWLSGNGGLVVRRAAWVSACVVTLRLVVEGAQLVRICGWDGVWSGARYVDVAGHPYLYTHPNVSSMLAGMAALVFMAYWPALWKGRRGEGAGWRLAALWGSAAGAAADVWYVLMMGSRGPQMAFAAAALLLPVFWLPGWKWRLAAVLAGAVAGCVLVAGAGRINPRFEDRMTMRGANRRADIWRCATGRVSARPWTGWGYGKRAFHRMIYEHPKLPAPRQLPFVFPHAHSYWLMLVVQGGYVALAAGLAAWGGLALGLLLALRRIPGSAMAARATPALLLTLLAMVLGYGVADFPDSVLRTCQFLLAAAAVACIADASEGNDDEC